MDLPASVHDRQSAVIFIEWCVAEIGLGFHPDTRFDDYIRFQDRLSLFAPAEVTALEQSCDASFEILGDLVYDIAAKEFEQLMLSMPADGESTISTTAPN